MDKLTGNDVVRILGNIVSSPVMQQIVKNPQVDMAAAMAAGMANAVLHPEKQQAESKSYETLLAAQKRKEPRGK